MRRGLPIGGRSPVAVAASIFFAILVASPGHAGQTVAARRDGKSPAVPVGPQGARDDKPAEATPQPRGPDAAASDAGVPPIAPTTLPPEAANLTPAHVAKARQLIYAIGVPDAFEVASSDALAQIAQVMAQSHPELVNDMNSVLDQLRPEVAKQTEDMVDVTARFYASVFTESDIDTILAFFNSAAGKKWNSAQRDIYKQLTSGIQAWQQKVIVTMVARVRQEMKKKGHDL